MFNQKNSTGMTLLELMFGLMLSIFTLISIFQIYLIAESSRLTQNTLITLEENMLSLHQLFKQRFKEYSYFGCAKLTEDFPFKNNSPYSLNSHNQIAYYQDQDGKMETDGIRIWHASIQNATLLEKLNELSVLYMTTSLPVAVDDNLIISDCKTAETFKVKQIIKLTDGQLKIITASPLSKYYDKNSEIYRLEIDSYFIGRTSYLDQNKQPIDALYLKDIHGVATELVSGVSQMKIFFSTVENNKLSEFPLKELTNATGIQSISFATELTVAAIHKNWNVYVSLS